MTTINVHPSEPLDDGLETVNPRARALVQESSKALNDICASAVSPLVAIAVGDVPLHTFDEIWRPTTGNGR